ncbi:MAG: hypothetical protein AUK48_04960 [Oscillatoriales cyanobacterium CG2_30_44_21]|nr:MAG: hypothetical protein AUK48_04960 [Oscillatoriales cyanobacterium CG2_30_44_21]
MSTQIFSNLVFVGRLLLYSAIASAVIKYVLPNWNLLARGISEEAMNLISISLITLPVGFFAFVLWLKR